MVPFDVDPQKSWLLDPDIFAIFVVDVHDWSVQLFTVTKSLYFSVSNRSNDRLMISLEEMVHLQSALLPYFDHQPGAGVGVTPSSPSDIEPDVIPFDGLHEHPPQPEYHAQQLTFPAIGPVAGAVIVVGAGVVTVVAAGVVVVVGAGVVVVVTAGVVLVVAGNVSSADVAISRALNVLEYSRTSSIRLCFHFRLHSLV